MIIQIRPTKWLWLLLGCLLVVPASAAKYAVLVGIGEYGNPAWRLKATNNDLALMGDLCRQWGIPAANTVVLRDSAATRAAIVAALRRADGKAARGDEFTFYFSGHAVEVYDTSGDEAKRNPLDHDDEALVTAPASPGGQVELLIDDQLATLLSPLQSKGVHVVSVLDCCYSYDGTKAVVPRLEMGAEKTLQGKIPNLRVPARTPAERSSTASPGLLLAAGQFRQTTREVYWPAARTKVPVSPLTLALWAESAGSDGWTCLLAGLDSFHKRKGFSWKPALEGTQEPWRRCVTAAPATLYLLNKAGKWVLVESAQLRALAQ